MGNGRTIIDLTGRRFGRLSVLRMVGRVKPYPDKTTTHLIWLCRCDCGAEKEIPGPRLRSNTKSCGCDRFAALARASTKHGHNPGSGSTPEYRAWSKIKGRCHNPKDKKYADYGARGIRVCDEWRDDFPRFLADMGLRPSAAHSIDREDNDKGYEPGNCRWATVLEQAANKRNTVRLTANGVTKHVAEWARDLGCRPDAIMGRLRRGWPEHDAVTVPVDGKRKWKRHILDGRPLDQPES